MFINPGKFFSEIAFSSRICDTKEKHQRTLLKPGLYFHSPFSQQTLYAQKQRALLLSFALSEIFACVHEKVEDWSVSSHLGREKAHDAPLDKLQEHVSLLMYAFPSETSLFFEFKELLHRLTYCINQAISFPEKQTLKECFLLLEPLIKECKSEESFLFFLLKHHESLSHFVGSSYLPSLLQELYPEGLSKIQTLLCDYFHRKGFTGLIPEVTLLLQEVKRREIVL